MYEPRPAVAPRPHSPVAGKRGSPRTYGDASIHVPVATGARLHLEPIVWQYRALDPEIALLAAGTAGHTDQTQAGGTLGRAALSGKSRSCGILRSPPENHDRIGHSFIRRRSSALTRCDQALASARLVPMPPVAQLKARSASLSLTAPGIDGGPDRPQQGPPVMCHKRRPWCTAGNGRHRPAPHFPLAPSSFAALFTSSGFTHRMAP